MKLTTIAFVVGMLLLPVGTYTVWTAARAAGVGAAAMAKVVCSCVFVDNRTLSQCRADDPPGFDGISVTIDVDEKTATGQVFGFIGRKAAFTPHEGCTLEP